MAEMKNSGEFATKIGFVMASVGSAVGMGNIWMFPYRVGQYGGCLLYTSCSVSRSAQNCPRSSRKVSGGTSPCAWSR